MIYIEDIIQNDAIYEVDNDNGLNFNLNAKKRGMEEVCLVIAYLSRTNRIGRLARVCR